MVKLIAPQNLYRTSIQVEHSDLAHNRRTIPQITVSGRAAETPIL